LRQGLPERPQSGESDRRNQKLVDRASNLIGEPVRK
jgi:hypothetical protein